MYKGYNVQKALLQLFYLPTQKTVASVVNLDRRNKIRICGRELFVIYAWMFKYGLTNIHD